MLLAKSIFTNSTSLAHIDHKYTEINVVKALSLFINQSIKPMLEFKKVENQDFRDERLWTADVRLLYSMNEINIRKIYSHYCANISRHSKKPHNSNFMELNDCVQLFMKDKRLEVRQDQIKTAFVQSKMSVVEETNVDAIQAYNKLLFVEFLEFLARIAELYFEESEMEDLDLHVKIEYLLDEILPLVDAKRVK